MFKLNKRGVLYFLISLFSITFVNAASNTLPTAMKNVLNNIFNALPLAFRANADVVIFKIMLFFLVFTVLFMSTKKVFHGASKRIGVIVALILALTSVLLIPSEIVRFLFIEYSAVVAILLGLFPVILGLTWWKNTDKESVMRCIILTATGALSVFVGSYFIGAGEQNQLLPFEEIFYSMSGQFAFWGGVLLVILGVICLFRHIKMGGGPGPGPGPDPPGPDPPGPDPPGPDPPGPDPRPPDVDPYIRRIQQLLQQLEVIFQQYIVACNVILDANHAYHNPTSGGSPLPPSADMWNTAINLGQSWERIRTEIIRVFTNMENLTNYHLIPEDRQRIITGLATDLTNAELRMSQYMQNFQQRLNNNQPSA